MRHNLKFAIKLCIVALLGAGFLSCTGEVPIEIPPFAGILYSAGLIVEESARYSVSVDYQGFHVQSECVVPAVTEIRSIHWPQFPILSVGKEQFHAP